LLEAAWGRGQDASLEGLSPTATKRGSKLAREKEDAIISESEHGIRWLGLGSEAFTDSGMLGPKKLDCRELRNAL
jgi:hypothetical protein